MNLSRFLNVGQGLFYSGRIGVKSRPFRDLDSNCYNCFSQSCLNKYHIEDCSFRFVYDCGSESPSSNKYIERAINNDFYYGEKIDIVFLSHLHDDHINGFKKLNDYTKVENVVLPFLYNDQIILFTYLAISSNYDLSTDEYEIFDKKFNLYSKLYSEESKQINDMQSNGIFWKKVDSQSYYDYYEKYIQYKGWIFFLLNKRIKKTIIEKIKDDIKDLVGNYDMKSIVRYVKSSHVNLYNIAKIYIKHLGKNINLSSTIVMHHPVNDLNNISMLTGDAEFDSNMIKICNKYLSGKNITYLQIPHHGSYNNWNKMKTLKESAVNLYLSYGIGNVYKHPSSKVVNEIHTSGRPLHISIQSLFFVFPWNEYWIL